jgi:hypothetical protein
MQFSYNRLDTIKVRLQIRGERAAQALRNAPAATAAKSVKVSIFLKFAHSFNIASLKVTIFCLLGIKSHQKKVFSLSIRDLGLLSLE